MYKTLIKLLLQRQCSFKVVFWVNSRAWDPSMSKATRPEGTKQDALLLQPVLQLLGFCNLSVLLNSATCDSFKKKSICVKPCGGKLLFCDLRLLETGVIGVFREIWRRPNDAVSQKSVGFELMLPKIFATELSCKKCWVNVNEIILLSFIKTVWYLLMQV